MKNEKYDFWYQKKLKMKCLRHWKKYHEMEAKNQFIPIKISIKDKIYLNKTENY